MTNKTFDIGEELTELRQGVQTLTSFIQQIHRIPSTIEKLLLEFGAHSGETISQAAKTRPEQAFFGLAIRSAPLQT